MTQHRYKVRFTEELTYEMTIIAKDADDAREKWKLSDENKDGWILRDSNFELHYIQHEGKADDESK